MSKRIFLYLWHTPVSRHLTLPWVEAARTLGHQVYVFATQEDQEISNLASEYRVLRFSGESWHAIRDFIKSNQIDYVYSTTDPIYRSLAKINDLLRLPGLTGAQAMTLSEKGNLYRMLRRLGAPSLPFDEPENFDALRRLKWDHRIFVKPTASTGTFSDFDYGYRIFESSDAFAQHLADTLQVNAFNTLQHKSSPLGRVIVQPAVQAQTVTFHMAFDRGVPHFLVVNDTAWEKECMYIQRGGAITLEPALQAHATDLFGSIGRALQLDKVVTSVQTFIIDGRIVISDFNVRLGETVTNLMRSFEPDYIRRLLAWKLGGGPVPTLQPRLFVFDLPKFPVGRLKSFSFAPTPEVSTMQFDGLQPGLVVPDFKHYFNFLPKLFVTGDTQAQIDDRLARFHASLRIDLYNQ